MPSTSSALHWGQRRISRSHGSICGPDAPLAAVGGAVLVSILLNILDQLDALEPYRNAFPGHYSRAWQDALAVSPDYGDMLHGALWSLVWAVAFTMLAYRRFRRTDILS